MEMSDMEPSDVATSDLSATAHDAASAARVALLLFAAELALDTLPVGPEREASRSALAVAARVAEGSPVEPRAIVESIQNEEDEGPLMNQQLAQSGPQAQAWGAVAVALGYAACQEYLRLGRNPPTLVENFDDGDAIDACIRPLSGVPDLDWKALGRATAWVREHASKASEGWGQPLPVESLQRIARTEGAGQLQNIYVK